jgi:hypothetical protein
LVPYKCMFYEGIRVSAFWSVKRVQMWPDCRKMEFWQELRWREYGMLWYCLGQGYQIHVGMLVNQWIVRIKIPIHTRAP